MLRKTRIKKHELGLWFRHGDFFRLLDPGTYWVPMFGENTVQVVATFESQFNPRSLPLLVREPAVRERLNVIDLKDDERALVWKDGRLEAILAPGLHAYWKEPHDIDFEIVDVTKPRFEHPKLDAVLSHASAREHLRAVDVDSNERLLVFDAGELIESCGAGRHAFWTRSGRVTWKAVDLRETAIDVSGQEIMSADKVTLRLNVVVSYRVSDPVRAISVVSDFGQSIYREAQLALRAAVGGRTLETLLSDKEAVGDEVRAAITARASTFGVMVHSVGIRDVILPGEMKTILNQVIEAQKQAEANLIRRREETAAARSQANTAKLLAENPVLARMKELEALQEILRGSKSSFVFGAGDLREQIRTLITDSGEG